MDEIVIAGISGRLPESNNLEEFWENLINGVDMVTEDNRRWTPGECVQGYGGWEIKSNLFGRCEVTEATSRTASKLGGLFCS